VSDQEKTRRIVALQALQREIQLGLHVEAIGSEVHVLVDSISRRRDLELSGRTLGNTVVHFPGPPEWLGETVAVRITRGGPYSLDGEVAATPRPFKPDPAEAQAPARRSRRLDSLVSEA
jgi:tRNA-2-methylthio-N6-dimethylallyladenosine synthase